MTKKIHIIVGMSGGVDSSVAALLLKNQGHHIEGLFMKNWDEDDGSDYCTAKQDLEDAKQVCAKLNIKLHVANFAAEYWDQVFDYFLQEYKQGRTPNPDILCNREIKFQVFLDYAKSLGADKIATGHYARIATINEKTHLLKGLDQSKDQSYFLHALTEAQLSQAVFPLGELQKTEVRKIASSEEFAIHNKKDSTGICFIGERRFKDFLARYVPKAPGPIETLHGEKIGKHDGIAYYTIGQRHGLNIGGLKNYSEEPWYIVSKSQKNNTLIVAQGSENPALYQSALQTEPPHWICNTPTNFPYSCTAKIRYRQMDQACELTKNNDGLIVSFSSPQRSVTPGQFAVFYQEDICLGGAVIESAINQP